MKNHSRIAYRLAVPLAALMALQGILGVLFRDVYRDNAFVRSAWHGNDIVTSFVAVPLLAYCLYRDRKGSGLRTRVCWLGILAYAAYNYAFYLFGGAFNSFFLIFVALFTLSAYGLFLGLANLDVNEVSRIFPNSASAKGVSIYMAFWGVALGALWIGQSLHYVFSGQLPGMVTATEHPTNITGALDLSMMVPAVLLGATLLWRQRPWGYIIALIMNIKGALYALVLAVSSFLGAQAGIPGLGAQIPLWAVLCLASCTCCAVLLKRA